MEFVSHSYDDAADLDRMRSVLIEGRRVMRHSRYSHIGDLDWALFYDPDQKRREDTIRLWSDEHGRTVGWGRLQGSVYFEHHVLPELRGSPVEAEIVEWCERAVSAGRPQASEDGSTCRTEIFQSDASTSALLWSRGFVASRETGLYFAQELHRPLPSPSVLAGFVVRAMTPDDIEQRAAVHFAAFSPGSRMTPEGYRAFMKAPGYDLELDSVVQAPDGRLAAYAMAWLDKDNGVGEFEPVGCHPDFRRLGLARAALHRGLLTMKERGMTTAIVYTNAENTAAAALYPSAGFALVDRFVTMGKPEAIA